MNREPASVLAARREAYQEQACGHRGHALDAQRINRLCELIDVTLLAESPRGSW